MSHSDSSRCEEGTGHVFKSWEDCGLKCACGQPLRILYCVRCEAPRIDQIDSERKHRSNTHLEVVK